MRFPRLKKLQTARLWTEQFTGLDRRPRTYDGAFSAMGNMTGDPWPLLSSRKKRGLMAGLENPQGLLALGKLCWIDGDTLYYGGEATPVNSLSLDESMLPKRMAAMGAYVLIFPDGMYYNTADPTDFGSINRLYQSPAGESVTYTLCAMDGTEYPAGDMTAAATAPAHPAEGDFWLDTGGDVHALNQWLGGEWVGISSVYVKISAPGIGQGLRVQDSVTVSGIAYTGDSMALKDQLESLNEAHVVQARGDDFLVVVGVIDQMYTQTAGCVRADRKVPEMDFLIECGNRLWGCRYGEENGEFVNRIYASALGDFRNFQKFQGTSQDSYYVNVGTDGPFTGAAVHRGSPWFFKAGCVHHIYGEKPANFQTQVTLCDGVRPGCGASLVPWNGALYYVGAGGPQYFESLPQPVGKALGKNGWTAAAAGQARGIYYLSAREENGSWSLYTLNMEKGLWHREDDSHALAFAELNGDMYMLLANGLLYCLNGAAGVPEEERVTWYAETAPMGYEYPQHQYVSRLLLRLKLGEDAECALSVQYDSDGIWHPKGVLHGGGRVKTCLVPIVPRRCQHLSLRLEGSGDMQLYGLARELVIGSDQ